MSNDAFERLFVGLLIVALVCAMTVWAFLIVTNYGVCR